MPGLKTIEWADDAVRLVDQTLLPGQLVHARIDNIKDMHQAIRVLQVRGAPAIGIAAAFGLYLGVRDFPNDRTMQDFLAYVEKHARYLATSRPTAVNLFWALDRMKAVATSSAVPHKSIAEVKEILLAEARAMCEEDRQMCRAIGEHGFELLRNCSAVLTHCNAGGLATAEYGTALAPIYVGAEQGKKIHVFADETRPLLQGARITAFELKQAGIPVTLICDNMAAVVMRKGRVQAAIVGADRIASNGDTANKIGTYTVALLAKHHGIPFYVAAPASTFDLSIESGDQIPIEERHAQEITQFGDRQVAPEGIEVFNPAFDVTPNELITALITEKGVIRPPFRTSIPKVLLGN